MDQTDKMPVREVIRRIVTPMLVILVCLGGAWVFYITATIPTPSSPDPVPLTVRVQQVEPESVALKVLSQGTVIPSVETALIPEVSGKVIEISESLVAGGFFNSGDVLLRLDEADLKSATRQYEASLTKASAEFEHASFEHNRWKKLREDGLISDSAFNEVLRRFRIAESAVTTASEQLEQAKRDLTRTVIRAPFTGSVRSKQVDLGQFISRGVQIAVLYATEAVEVRLAISDARLAFLDIPLTTRGHIAGDVQPDVLLWADYGGKETRWEGKIIRSEAEIDQKSRTVQLVAQVDNAGQELPLSVGLFVRAQISGRVVDDLYQIPRGALRNNNHVAIVDDQNRIRLRSVTPLSFVDEYVLIQEGLNPGDQVCLTPLQTAIEGMEVDPIIET